MVLNKRQKILIPLIITAFAYVIWQVYDMLNSNTSTVLRTLTPAAIPSVLTNNTKNIMMSATVASTPANSTTGSEVTPQQAPTPKDIAENTPLTPTQNEYIQLMNQYQLVKMHRLITDEEASIAAAKQRIAALNSETSKLSGTGSEMNFGANSQNNNYRLVYVDRQDGQWSATLSKNGHFYEVKPGEKLMDGTQVTKIDAQGVIIAHGDTKTLLTFSGAMPYVEPANPPQAIQPASQVQSVGVITKPKARKRLKLKTPIATGQSNSSALRRTTEKLENTSTLSLTAEKQKTITEKIESTKPKIQQQTDENIPLTLEQAKTFDQLEGYLESKKTSGQSEFSDDEKALLKRPANHYTLQLMGSQKIQKLTGFIEKNHLKNKACIFHTYYLNKDWYVLVYGDYNSFHEAMDATSTLPNTAQELKPWVRRMSSVQKAIELNQSNNDVPQS